MIKTAIIGLGLACAVGLIVLGAFAYGKRAGEQEAKVDAAVTTIENLVERGKIDGEVNSVDTALLCNDLGLPDGERDECLRRVAEANAKP